MSKALRVLRVVVMRHAQSDSNVRHGGTRLVLTGRCDGSPLTGRGRAQARAAAAKLVAEGLADFDAVWSSPAVRTKDTAKLVCQEVGMNSEKIVYCDLLHELDQGEWAGKRRHECYTPEVLEQYRRNPMDFKPKDGESQREVEARMNLFFEAMLLPQWKASKKDLFNVCVLSHGFAIKCFLRELLHVDPADTWKIKVENASFFVVCRTEVSGWQIIFPQIPRPISLKSKL
ncbi:histidine phosphatase family protein [Pelomyxa schiedti]|nr:histidine phosphatase family protein [Pelomyxa schiedti]